MKKIGPTFSHELKEAGLLGAAFAWGEDGTFTFDPSMNDEDIAKVMGLYEAHDPDRMADEY